MIERVVIHARFRSNKVGNSLRMLASNDRMVKLEVVQSFVRVLEEELNHLDAVGEGVKGHLYTLCNRNELVILRINSMACVQSQRTKVPR